MKKVLVFIVAIIACISFRGMMTVFASTDYATGGEIKDTEIVLNEDNYFSITSGNFTLSGVTFKRQAGVDITNVISVGKDATLVLTDVDFSEIMGSNAINCEGKMILTNVDFGSGFACDILLNPHEDNITNSCILGGDIVLNNITISSGYITLDESVNLKSITNVTLTNGFVGKRIVTGDNTIASYYLDKFNYVKESDDNCYFDYVGDDYATFAEKYKSNDELVGGDIILTEDYANYKESKDPVYIGGKYCTGVKFMKSSQTLLCVSGGPTTNLYLNNYSCLMGQTYIIAGQEDKSLATANIKIMNNDTLVAESSVQFPNHSSWSVFVDIPNGYKFVNVTDSVEGENISVTSVFDNSKFAKVILTTSSTNTTTTFDVIVNVEKDVVITPVDVYMDNTEGTYSSDSLKDIVKPYYILDNENYYLDYSISFKGESVEDILNAGDYTITIESEVDGISFNTNTFTFTVNPYEITIVYTNDVHEYDGESKSLNASAVGVFDGDTVNVNLLNNSAVELGNYIVTASLDNDNYIIANDYLSHTLVIEKHVDVLLENTSATYAQENFISNIKPYYMFNGNKNYLDFVVLKDGHEVNEIINAYNYLVSITSLSSANIYFNNTTCDFNVLPREIQINYSNYTYEYDGESKSLNATLVGVLPNDEVNITLSNNSAITVGSHLVTASIDNANYVVSADTNTCNLIISKGTYNVSAISFENTTFEYNGDAIELKIDESSIPDFVVCGFNTDNCVTPGNYNIVVTFELEENEFYDRLTQSSKTFAITITKKSLMVDDYLLTFEDGEFIYDGNSHSLSLNGTIPSEVDVRCEGNNQINAKATGYLVTYYFDYDNSLYTYYTSLSASLYILPLEVDVRLIKDAYEYTGSAISPQIEIVGILGSDDYTYSCVSYINVGNYDVNITLNNTNYILKSHNLKFSIAKKNIDLSEITLNKSEMVYNGEVFIPDIEGDLPEGIELFELVFPEIKNVGDYTISADIEVSGNYSVSSWSKTFKVMPKSITILFSNYDNLYQDGDVKSIGVSLSGVVEDDFDKYYINYTPRPINAGEYTCTVTLMNDTNYVIVGDNFKKFTIYPNVKVYNNDDMSVTVQGGNGDISDLKISCTNKDEEIENKLRSLPIKISGYNVINLDGESTNVSIELKTNLNISKSNKIKVFKLSNNILEEVEFTLKDNKITFQGDSNFQYVIVEEGSNGLLVALIIIFGVLSVALFTVVIILVKKKNKAKK